MKPFAYFLSFLVPTCGWSQVRILTPEALDSLPKLESFMGEQRDSFEYFTLADTAYSLYRLPQTFSKPEPWKNRETATFKMYEGTYPENFTLKDALAVIDKEKDFWKICCAKNWCAQHYKEAFPYLVARLSDKRKVGIKNTADLIIWERNMTGDLKFYGHGGSINEDIFTVAGRASWILNDITGERFAQVHGNLTREDAQRFKNLWMAYLQALR